MTASKHWFVFGHLELCWVKGIMSFCIYLPDVCISHGRLSLFCLRHETMEILWNISRAPSISNNFEILLICRLAPIWGWFGCQISFICTQTHICLKYSYIWKCSHQCVVPWWRCTVVLCFSSQTGNYQSHWAVDWVYQQWRLWGLCVSLFLVQNVQYLCACMEYE